jgi:hypothetical protein
VGKRYYDIKCLSRRGFNKVKNRVVIEYLGVTGWFAKRREKPTERLPEIIPDCRNGTLTALATVEGGANPLGQGGDEEDKGVNIFHSVLLAFGRQRSPTHPSRPGAIEMTVTNAV